MGVMFGRILYMGLMWKSKELDAYNDTEVAEEQQYKGILWVLVLY